MSIDSTLHEEFTALQKGHNGLDDDVRLSHDGSIWMYTITDGGNVAWRSVAPSIPKASGFIGRYFNASGGKERHLRVADLRTAIAVRDKLLAYVIDMRVRREIDKETSKSTDNWDSVPTTL